MRSALIFILSICGVAAGSTTSVIFGPGYTFYENAGGWYKYHETPATWHDANLQCHLEGGVLSSPVNQNQKQTMTDILKKSAGENNLDIVEKLVFTGLHSNAYILQGNFATVEGTLLLDIEHKWAPNEPDNKENTESCIAMFQNGSLADVNCNQTLPYFCYKTPDSNVVWNSKCGTIDTEYAYKSETGHCYKYHTTLATWSLAQMTCEAERASLAIINSEEESNILKQMFDEHIIPIVETHYLKLPNPRKEGRDAFTYEYTHIGFRAIEQTRLWMTIEGQTLAAAGFSTFSTGEPNNKLESESCGSMFGLDGKLNDIFCTQLAPFICEKLPAPAPA